MKKYMLATIPLSAFLFTGCAANTSTTTPDNTPKTSVIVKVPTLSNPKITEQGKDISVSVYVTNPTNKALPVHASDFALSSGAHVLSPENNAQIPSQIPAKSKVQVTLSFNPSGQLSGKASGKLAFQPSSNTPEEFISLGSFEIPKTYTTKPAVSQKAAQTTPSTPSQAKPSLTYTTTNSGYDLVLHFRNIGTYTPIRLEMTTSADPLTPEVATMSDGQIEPQISAWNLDNNGDIVYWFHNYQFGSDVTALVTCTSPGSKPITLSVSYHVPKG